jgi:hypothetical protein
MQEKKLKRKTYKSTKRKRKFGKRTRDPRIVQIEKDTASVWGHKVENAESH